MHPQRLYSFYISYCPALATLKIQVFCLLLMPLSFLALAFSTYLGLLPSAPHEEVLETSGLVFSFLSHGFLSSWVWSVYCPLTGAHPL